MRLLKFTVLLCLALVAFVASSRADDTDPSDPLAYCNEVYRRLSSTSRRQMPIVICSPPDSPSSMSSAMTTAKHKWR